MREYQTILVWLACVLLAFHFVLAVIEYIDCSYFLRRTLPDLHQCRRFIKPWMWPAFYWGPLAWIVVNQIWNAIVETASVLWQRLVFVIQAALFVLWEWIQPWLQMFAFIFDMAWIAIRTAFELGFAIDRRCFRPRPSVDSAVLTIRRRAPSILPDRLAPDFRSLLRQAWA